MKSKVSVVIPIYNVKKYIKTCMESLLQQDYKNIEIICIDDGSTDGTAEILDKYCKNPNIKILHKKNTGYGNSMNIGISMATGEYISILEPDDFLGQGAISTIMKIFESESDLDFVKCDYACIQGEGKSQKIYPTVIMPDKSFYNRVLMQPDIIELTLGKVAHWSAIYRKSFLEENHITFNETPGASYQDSGFWFQAMMRAKKVYLSDKYFYYYRSDNPGSSMNNPDKVYCVNEEYDYIESKISEYSVDLDVFSYYTVCRLTSVKATYSRIKNEYRYAYLKRCQRDFKRMKEQGKLSDKLLNAEDRNLLVQIIEDVDALWEEKNKACEFVKGKIKDCKKVYIYGAGEIAKFIYRLLPMQDRNNIIAFLVSKMTPDVIQDIDGIPVVEFNGDIDIDMQSIVIIGTSERYSNEIKEMLIARNITNYYLFKGGIA